MSLCPNSATNGSEQPSSTYRLAVLSFAFLTSLARLIKMCANFKLKVKFENCQKHKNINYVRYLKSWGINGKEYL